MAHRYFTKDIHGSAARITGPDALHLTRVLRAKPGDVLTLCDGKGRDYTARVTEAAGELVTLEILESVSSQTEPALRADVYLAWAKGDKLDLALQKCVELGAASIIPFVSSGCLAIPKKDKSERMQRIIQEAAKQCGRGVLPTLGSVLSFPEMLKSARQNSRALFFHPTATTGLSSAIAGARSFSLITGPESGFTEEEAKAAEAAGCILVTLGPRILRCETAPLAALAALMALGGELG